MNRVSPKIKSDVENTTLTENRRIILTGAAGLVGQNLIPRLKANGWTNITAIDKHPANIAVLREQHNDIEIIETDLSREGSWSDRFRGCYALVLNHAQIGALEEKPFIDNNIIATRNVLAAAENAGIEYIVHISSSVVNSMARDFYTESKKEQERLVAESNINSCILRPTLMFGWFDRKHLGWLARFMKKVPVFPIPGNGKYIRQPLYVGDFCNVIISALNNPKPAKAYNISGREKLYYINLIRLLRKSTRARTPIVTIPYWLFWFLLKIYALVDRNPPFTTSQLKALVTPDEFEIVDWPSIFGIEATPLELALEQTFQDPVYSNIMLEF